MPSRTPIRISSARYDGETWLYLVVTADSQRSAEVRENQIGFFPGVTPFVPTPTSPFEIFSGYQFVTTDKVGEIPAGSSVAIGMMWFDGKLWRYQIMTADGKFIEANQKQITRAEDITPNALIPSPKFSSYPGMGVHWLILTAPIGDIPAGTPVKVSTASFNGLEWVYQAVVSEDETAFFEVLESQLDYAPGTTPNAPTPTAGD